MVPGVVVVRLDAPIYFANIQWMEDKLVEYEETALRWERRGTRWWQTLVSIVRTTLRAAAVHVA